MAAGWGPELGAGYMASRWAEDWTGMPHRGAASWLKSEALAEDATLTVSAELRVRHVQQDNVRLMRGNDARQTQLRAVMGADVRFNDHVRVYAEIGAGAVDRMRESATPNFRNDLSLQQLFVDARAWRGDTLFGAMLGRQEFADGPRQLLSLSDGPNLHRSWNGVRLYLHGARYRVGAFDLRATRLKPGAFDERVDHGEKLQGLTASFIVSQGSGSDAYLDPFWYLTDNALARIGPDTGRDRRNTVGLRLWGRRGALRYDWTAAYQRGRSLGERRAEAWGVFVTYSLGLSDRGWKPRASLRLDLASGGGAHREGVSTTFNPLYVSSNYLGEGQLLGLSNLAMVAPSLSFSPLPRTTVTIEYGHARRRVSSDAVYAGGMRAYAGTHAAIGHHIGNLTRLSATWTASDRLGFTLAFEHLSAGTVLRSAGYPSGAYAYLSATYRH